MTPHTASAVSPFFFIEAATVTTVTTTKLFPLPLTPFEYYYWCDDRPEYPTMYPVVLDFAGVLQREPLERALGGPACHPMLNTLARIVLTGGPSDWQRGATPTIDWAPDDVPSHIRRRTHRSAAFLRAAALGAVFPIPKRLAADPPSHHACCDGLGIFRFLEDLLVFYHREIAGADQARRPVDVGWLRARRFPAGRGRLARQRAIGMSGQAMGGHPCLAGPVERSPATPGDLATHPVSRF